MRNFKTNVIFETVDLIISLRTVYMRYTFDLIISLRAIYVADSSENIG